MKILHFLTIILALSSTMIYGAKTFDDLGFNVKDIPMEQAFKYTDGETILCLYQLMKDVHEILTDASIEYWVESGTLLGTIREKGIIKWDTDLDIQLPVIYETALVALKPVFESLGYYFIEMPFGYKIYSTFEGIDILITEEFEGRIRYQREEIREWWARREPYQIYFKPDEVYPLKLYQFGDIQVYGPQNPYPWLFHAYGIDCLEVAYYQVSHGGNTYSKFPLKLTDENRNCASPKGPLLDRVKRLKLK